MATNSRKGGTRRKMNELKIKSIWEEKLVDEVCPNRKHSTKLWNWLIQRPDKDISDAPFNDWNVPRAVSAKLISEFQRYSTKIVQKDESERKDTTKLLVELQDGHRVETVVIRHKGHSTVCVSSQVGCQMGCRFCATGTMGIIGDLTTSEILEQLMHAITITPIRNVVFMGMGEPLNNYDNVKAALVAMCDEKRFGLSPKHVTVSTVGVVKNMYRLTNEMPAVSLALSLHAPNQEVRLRIIPTASATRLSYLMEAVDHHIKEHHIEIQRNKEESRRKGVGMGVEKDEKEKEKEKKLEIERKRLKRMKKQPTSSSSSSSSSSLEPTSSSSSSSSSFVSELIEVENLNEEEEKKEVGVGEVEEELKEREEEGEREGEAEGEGEGEGEGELTLTSQFAPYLPNSTSTSSSSTPSDFIPTTTTTTTITITPTTTTTIDATPTTTDATATTTTTNATTTSDSTSSPPSTTSPNSTSSSSPPGKRPSSSKTTGVMIEYILISGVNDLPEHARELVQLLAPRKEHVLLNLIPYNPTSVNEDFTPPSKESVSLFFSLCREGGIHTRIRQEMGQDIAGACGQLALVNANPPRNTRNNNGNSSSNRNEFSSFSSSSLKIGKRERDLEDLTNTTTTSSSSSSSTACSSTPPTPNTTITTTTTTLSATHVNWRSLFLSTFLLPSLSIFNYWIKKYI